jgi:hypothetical protein
MTSNMDCDDCTDCLHSGLCCFGTPLTSDMWHALTPESMFCGIIIACERSAHHISPSDGDIWKCWIDSIWHGWLLEKMHHCVTFEIYVVVKIYIVFWVMTLWSHRWLPAVFEDHTASIFYPEAGDSKFVQNVGIRQTVWCLKAIVRIQLFLGPRLGIEIWLWNSNNMTSNYIKLSQCIAEWYERSGVGGSIKTASIMYSIYLRKNCTEAS